MRSPGLAAAAGLLALWPMGAWPVAPARVLRLDVYGGQIFFEGRSSYSGMTDWLAAARAKVSDKDSFVQGVDGRYRRTRELRELVTGGSVTTETLDNTVFLRWVRSLGGDWTLKPNLSFRNELITTDPGESLGAGVFDHNKLSLGMELERRGERLESLRQGLAVYGTRFYHYRASRSPVEHRELRSGDRVLDFDAYEYSIAADARVREKTTVSASGLLSWRDFRGQPLVRQDGGFEDRIRRDLAAVWSLGVRQTVRGRAGAGLTAAYTRLFSDQSNLDALRGRFNHGYYDYGELSLRPSFSLAGGEALELAVSYDYSRREYLDRPVQVADGAYVGGSVSSDTHGFTCAAAYPLRRHVWLKASGAYRDVRSNMRYEGAYRYNYSYHYYFLGLGYGL